MSDPVLTNIFESQTVILLLAAAWLQRSALTLAIYDYDIKFVKSEDNYADFLSRALRNSISSDTTDSNNFLNLALDNSRIAIDYKLLKKETARTSYCYPYVTTSFI